MRHLQILWSKIKLCYYVLFVGGFFHQLAVRMEVMRKLEEVLGPDFTNALVMSNGECIVNSYKLEDEDTPTEPTEEEGNVH